jgi:uncharacterized protein (DUF302 family)
MLPHLFLTIVLVFTGAQANATDTHGPFSIADTVKRVPLAEGVTPEDAVDSMKLRANSLNMMFVAHQPLSKQLEAMGRTPPHIEIFQFCDPLIAEIMVTHDLIFAAYMPCRISLVQDQQGKYWLVMMDLDFFIQASPNMPPALLKKAKEVRDKLNSILEAGANGDL